MAELFWSVDLGWLATHKENKALFWISARLPAWSSDAVLRVFPPLKRCTYARGFRLHDEGVFWYKACELFNEVKMKYMLKKDGDEVDGAMSCEVFAACYVSISADSSVVRV